MVGLEETLEESEVQSHCTLGTVSDVLKLSNNFPFEHVFHLPSLLQTKQRWKQRHKQQYKIEKLSG